MKKINLLISVIVTFVVSCGGNDDPKSICDCNNKTNAVNVEDLKDTINYDKDIKMWYISVPEEGTIDNVQMFLPCNLAETYKKENMKVIFSGMAFDLTSKLEGVPAGTTYKCIDISSINNQF